MKIENIKKNDMVVVINDIYNVDEINNAIDVISGILPKIFAEIRSNIEHKELRILHNKGCNYFDNTTCNDVLDSDDYEIRNLIHSDLTDYISNSRNLFARINGNDYGLMQILQFENFPLWEIWDCVFNEDEKWDYVVSDVWHFIHTIRKNLNY